MVNFTRSLGFLKDGQRFKKNGALPFGVIHFPDDPSIRMGYSGYSRETDFSMILGSRG
jgi:hypothetical protein